MFNKKNLTFFAMMVAAVMALAACGGASGGEKITLAENPWPASELNVAVAKIIIEAELGNEVEIVALDETAQWDALAAGDLDASLEVWPGGHGERIEEYINNLGTVEDGGKLGPLGEIGWFVPTYVIDSNPALATWEGFAVPRRVKCLQPQRPVQTAGSWAPTQAGTNMTKRSFQT